MWESTSGKTPVGHLPEVLFLIIILTMKPSIYNHVVNLSGREILYNSFSNQFLPLTPEIKSVIDGNVTDNELASALESQHIMVNDDINEVEMVRNLFLRRKNSTQTYDLTINTSLQCNLKCWYCYETHIPKSLMPLSLVDKILRHLELKATSEPFKLLRLTFFGGEPMMNYKAVAALLDGVKTQSERYDYKVMVTFVTNGTYLSEQYVELLRPFDTFFQITIDGDQATHDSIRTYKHPTSSHGSYDKIISGLKLFSEAEERFRFLIRINYDDRVLQNLNQLISDIDFLDRRRTVISLHRVWQYKPTEQTADRVIDGINLINSHGFLMGSYNLSPRFEGCYADNMNQAVINYDGSVFKCTARDFTKSKSMGRLNSLGFIEWDTEAVTTRHNLSIPDICLKCSLLPSCPGICSQKRTEAKSQEELQCLFENGINRENIILINLKQQIINKKLKNYA